MGLLLPEGARSDVAGAGVRPLSWALTGSVPGPWRRVIQDPGTQPAAVAGHRYSTVAIVLHWTIAVAIVFQIILGWRMGGPSGPLTYAIFQLHKSVGITILLLSLLRLGWRLSHRAPALPDHTPAWEAFLARATHWAFYVVMIGLPLTGWMIVSTSRTAIPTVLYGLVPWPSIPLPSDLSAPAKKALHEASETGHQWLVWLTVALFVLHVAAALKHHFIDRDEVLGHMAPGARPGAFLEPRLWLLAAAGLGVIASAFAWGPVGRSPPPPPAAVAVEPVAATPPPPPAAETAAPAQVLVPATVAPSAWTVADSSTLGFRTSWGGMAIDGRFQRWKADILFSPDALDASRLKVTIDVASVTTGDSQRDSTLSTPDWFDAAGHPQAVFTATGFTKTGQGRYQARGTLQLRGVTSPLAVPFTLIITGDQARARGALSLDRTRFGVGQGEWAATDSVPAAVAVSFDLQARRAAP